MRLLLFHVVCFALDVVILAGLASRTRRPRAIAGAVAALVVLPLGGAGFVFHGEMPTFASMQLACWVLFLHAPLLGLGAAVVRRHRRRLAACLVLASLALLGVAYDAFVVEPHALEVTRRVVRSSKVTRPVRIVVLADIQTDHVGAYEARVVARAMAERPDLVLLPGDYVQLANARAWDAQVDAFRAMIRPLRAPLGAYAVQGNVDPSGRWQALFLGTSIEPLDRTTRRTRGEVSITALSFADSFYEQLRLDRGPGFHVVFGHGPDFALGDVDADLLVAGHTHGGQVVLPFFGPPLTLSQVPRAWASGRTSLPGGRTLIVSRGIGMERGPAPPLRFLCRPELVVIDVLPR